MSSFILWIFFFALPFTIGNITLGFPRTFGFIYTLFKYPAFEPLFEIDCNLVQGPSKVLRLELSGR